MITDVERAIVTIIRGKGETFTYEYGFLRREKGFHICTKCMMLIRELRAEQKEGEQNDR